jgi:hypothetical protein
MHFYPNPKPGAMGLTKQMAQESEEGIESRRNVHGKLAPASLCFLLGKKNLFTL